MDRAGSLGNKTCWPIRCGYQSNIFAYNHLLAIIEGE